MNFTEIPQLHFSAVNICLTSRMEIGLLVRRIISLAACDTYLVQEFLNHAFHGKEISFSVHTQSELHPFLRKFCQRQRFRQVNIAQLIEPHVFISVIVVKCQRGQHTVQRSSTHDTEILSQRVHDLDGISQRRILRNSQLVKGFRTLKGVHESL